MKTEELEGPALNWAVTLIELKRRQEDPNEYVKNWVAKEVLLGKRVDPYSSSWMWAGSIIDREFICIDYDKDWVYDPANADPDDEPDNGDRWLAWPAGNPELTCYGPTALVAAMRCYVKAKLGDEVEIPKELL